MSQNDSVHLFPPSAEFAAQATISGMDAYQALCAEAANDYTGYWARLAREHVSWKKPFTQVLDETNAPFYKWFADGTLNVSYNCLDRNVEAGPGRQGRHPFRNRRRRAAPGHLPRIAGHGLSPGQRPARQRHQKG